MDVLTEAHPDDPARDMARSGELLAAVAAGARGPLARVFVPGPTLCFGRLDELRPGFEAAREAALAHGFVPVRRLGGGQAAAYHHGCVVAEAVLPQGAVAGGIEARYAALTGLIVQALRGLGVPAEEGELPGEYCPGRFSVHAGGVKLAGVAQRSVKGAALVAAFVAVEDGAALRGVLTPVYAALGRAWAPSTAGAAEDVAPVTVGAVAAALTARLATLT